MSDGQLPTLGDDALAPPRPGDPLDEAATRTRVMGSMFGEDEVTLIGRFRVERTIGQGAMGRVYLAHDPELGRAVALKLIAPTPDGRADVRRLRLLREAQALAQLSHPNIVPIYEVGEHEGQVFLAMEFVAGADGRRFVLSQDPGMERILDIYRQAGAGLQAAHRGGLVHRDFKPDNILVGDDGRVRVLDFGLARPEGSDEVTDPNRLDSAELLRSPLTRTGAVLGTPAYLAPEVLDGREADALSDQFSFAVSVWEALTGTRPFVADSVPALYAAIERGPPLSNKIPGPLHRTLARALALKPGDRFPDMDSLVAALNPRGPTRFPWPAAMLGGLLVSSAGLWMARSDNPPQAPVATADDAEAMDDAFLQEAASLVRGGAYGNAETVLRNGTGDARRLRAADLELSGYVALADLAARHLSDSTKTELYLEQAETLAASEKISPATLAALDNARGRAATLSGDSGRAAELHRLAAAALRELRAPPLEVAQTLRALAMALADAGRHADALAEARGAVALLEQALGPDNPETGAATIDVARVLYLQGEIDESLAALEKALTLLTGSSHEADVRRRIGAAHHALGHYPQAKEHYLAELSLRESKQGAHHPDLVATLRNLGLVSRLQGDGEEALAYLERARQLGVTALGETHPTVAVVESSLGSHYHQQKDFDGARDHHRRALEIRAKRLGPLHPDTGRSHSNLGDTLSQAGRYDEAIPHLRSAAEILESSLGPEHEHLGYPLTALGRALVETGSGADAVAPLERALALRVSQEGHPLALATTRFHLARALQETDRSRAHELATQAHQAFAASRAYPEMVGKAAQLVATTSP